MNSWKTVSRVPHVPKNATFRPKCACLNGVVYWLLNDVRFTIVSFDMRHESFQIRRFSCDFYPVMYPNCMQVWNNLLSLFRVRHVGEMRYCDIYILNMKQSRLDLSRTLRMEWTSIAWPLGFNTGGSGQGIDVVIRTDTPSARLVSLITTEREEIELGMFEDCWCVDVYRESLLLLN